VSQTLPDLPNIDAELFQRPAAERVAQVGSSTHAPRILLLYGSLRARSFSKLLTLEAQRLLDAMGAETRIYSPEGLPLPDGHPEGHPKVQENIAVGDKLPFRELPITTSLIVCGALATRDFEPLHHDKAAAQDTGMSDVFMNILTSQGLMETYVTEWKNVEHVLVSSGVGVPTGALILGRD